MIRCSTLLLVALCCLSGCRGAEQREAHWVSCGIPHCALLAPPGVVAESRLDGRTLRHVATGMAVQARIVGEEELADGLEQYMKRQQDALSLTVRWTRPPDEADGFTVLGLSGTRPPANDVLLDDDPTRVQVVLYQNPRTGHVLELRLSGPASLWDQAWPALSQTMARVRFDGSF